MATDKTEPGEGTIQVHRAAC